jgi:hypothetical protein
MSKHHDAELILKLYDLRREATMRDARNWFWTFNPTSVQDIIEVLLSEHSGHYRMVISYWEMAAAMVNEGAIDEKLFNECNGEQIFVYSKIAELVPDIRNLFGSPDFLMNLETLIKRIPNHEEKIAGMKARMKKFAEMRAAREATLQAAAGA